MFRSLSSRIVSAVLALSAVAATGCGVSPETFAGTWTQTGTWTVAANGQVQTEPLEGSIQVMEGANGGIVFPLGTACSVPFDLEGNSAVLHPATTCNATVEGGNVTLTFTSGNAMLSSNLQVMTFSLAGTESFTLSDGRSGTVTFTQSSTLNKIAK